MFLVYACDQGGALAPEEPLSEIVLSASSLELAPGDTVRLEVTLINKNGKPMPSKVPLDWSSSNANVASVDQVGLVLAKNRGEAKITVARGSIQSSVPVTVRSADEPEDPGEGDPEEDPGDDDSEGETDPDDPGDDDSEDEPDPEPEPTELTVEPNSLELVAGETASLVATVKDQNGGEMDAEVEWSVSDTEVLAVEPDGMSATVTALAAGEATVTASVGELSAEASVEAIEPEPEEPEEPEQPGFGEWDFVLSDTIVQGDVVVPDGQKWLIGPGVEVEGNVRTVSGTVGMRPGSTLRFLGADPGRYVGGGMTYGPEFANDFGLWIGHGGFLDISCTPKVGWNRTGRNATWEPTDEYWIAPTHVGDWSPRRWFPGDPIPQADPRVPPAEVINVTRDCVIEGPAHIHIHSHMPQRIEYVRLERMGVSTASGPVLGRYALHFHHGEDGTRGTIVRGVAAVHSQAQVYVPHESHGITMIDNVSVMSDGPGLWWDLPEETSVGGVGKVMVGNETHELLVDRMAIVGVTRRFGDTPATVQVSGLGNTFRNSVIAGGGSRATSWRNGGCTSHNFGHAGCVWVWDDNVIHNNRGAGLFFWLNNSKNHLQRRQILYNNGRGIDNGAYRNSVRYEDVLIIGHNRGIILHSNSGFHEDDDGPAWYKEVHVHVDEGPALRTSSFQATARQRTLFEDCTLEPAPGSSPVLLNGDKQMQRPFLAVFRRCTDGARALRPEDIGHVREVLDGTSILIENADGTGWEVRWENGQRLVEEF